MTSPITTGELERIPVAFARSLRAAGMVVPVDATITFAEALACVGLHSPSGTYWAARATFVRRPEDIVAFNRVFAAFFGSVAGGTPPDPVQDQLLALDHDASDDQSVTGDDDDVQAVRFARHEVLRAKDFAAYSQVDRDEAARLLRSIRVHAPIRPSRRRVASRHARGHPDLRATMARSLRTGGEMIERRHRTRSHRPRRVVLLLDVSGSMEPYAREFVRFLHTAVVGRRAVEAFALGTRLTRITRDLTDRDPDAAISAAARRVVDWAGGTRLGDTLHEFNERFGARGMARGAIVVILSDGWDRGEPQLVAAAMERLSRVAHRIVWVNPLKASPGYVPLAQGMAAALPFVDEFVEGHSIAALERVAVAVGREPGDHRA